MTYCCRLILVSLTCIPVTASSPDLELTPRDPVDQATPVTASPLCQSASPARRPGFAADGGQCRRIPLGSPQLDALVNPAQVRSGQVLGMSVHRALVEFAVRFPNTELPLNVRANPWRWAGFVVVM